METIKTLLNYSAGVRREKLMGRDYLVVPLAMINPGILNGSQGPILYTAEETAKDPSIWNYVPIVLYHPFDSNNQEISARSKEVLNDSGLGVVLNSQFNGKLVAEGWFDIDRTREKAPKVLANLEANIPMELSTGLRAQMVPAENGAAYNGVPYSYQAVNYKPDHLAILPDLQGACSLKDGCGVLVNKSNGDNTMDKKEREALVESIVNGCDCYNDEDKATLLNMSDDALKQTAERETKRKEAEAVANAAKKGFEDAIGNSHKMNEDGTWETTPKKEEQTVTNTTTVTKGTESTTEKVETTVIPQNPIANMSEQDFLNIAPPSIANALRNGLELVNERTEEIIANLTSHLEGEEKERVTKELRNQSYESLRVLNALGPKKVEPTQPVVYSYAGVPAPVQNADSAKELQEDGLEVPVVNWSEVSKQLS